MKNQTMNLKFWDFIKNCWTVGRTYLVQNEKEFQRVLNSHGINYFKRRMIRGTLNIYDLDTLHR